jgi:hypothetical protein
VADQVWAELGTPGDLASAPSAQAGAGAVTTDIAVVTVAGELWWRLGVGAGGLPAARHDEPAGGMVAALGPDTDGAPIGALSGGDAVIVWVRRSAALAAQPWTALTCAQNNGAGMCPLRLPHDGGELRSLLLADGGDPWIVTLQDATGVYAPTLAPAPDLPGNFSISGPMAYVIATTTQGGPPQPHVVASVNVHEVWESAMRIGFPEAGWVWIDPGAIPAGSSTDLIDAAGVRLADGSWEV